MTTWAWILIVAGLGVDVGSVGLDRDNVCRPWLVGVSWVLLALGVTLAVLS
jgi:hypothetical protein